MQGSSTDLESIVSNDNRPAPSGADRAVDPADADQSLAVAVVDWRLLMIDRSLVVQVRFVTKLVLNQFTVVLDQSRMMINPLIITMFDDHSVAKSVDRFSTIHDQ